MFIYFIEEHPALLARRRARVLCRREHPAAAITSGVTLLETLVVPYRSGNTALAARYEALLTKSRGIRFMELDRSLLRIAAQLRAVFSIKTPDALQLAAALSGGCSVYLTNDRSLPRIPGLAILQVSDYAGSP